MYVGFRVYSLGVRVWMSVGKYVFLTRNFRGIRDERANPHMQGISLNFFTLDLLAVPVSLILHWDAYAFLHFLASITHLLLPWS